MSNSFGAFCVDLAEASNVSTRLVKAVIPSALTEVSVASVPEALIFAASRFYSIACRTKIPVFIWKVVAA